MALLSGCAEGFFFYPDKTVYQTPQSLGLREQQVQSLYFASADGTQLHGWWVRSDKPLPANQTVRPVLVHFHGNAANLTNHAPLSAWVAEYGFDVFMMDYRGFGQSQGKPGLQSVVQDAAAALDYVRKTAPAAPIVVLGQSLGAATGLRAVAQSPANVKLMISDSAFSSYQGIAREAAQQMGPIKVLAPALVPTLPGAQHDPITAITKLTVPVLVMHGTQDTVINVEHSKALHQAASAHPQVKLDPLMLIPGEGHIQAISRPAVQRIIRDRMLLALQQ